MNFFHKESKYKRKKNCGGGGLGGGRGEGKMDGQTNKPKPICLFNFFKVGGITMH